MVAAVLSGNRNFEGRIHPLARASYLASPPLVVAFALAGACRHRPHSTSRSASARDGTAGHARRDLAVTAEVRSTIADSISPELFRAHVRGGLRRRRSLARAAHPRRRSLCLGPELDHYIAEPPFFDGPDGDRRRPSATSSARACWPCSATR